MFTKLRFEHVESRHPLSAVGFTVEYQEAAEIDENSSLPAQDAPAFPAETSQLAPDELVEELVAIDECSPASATADVPSADELAVPSELIEVAFAAGDANQDGRFDQNDVMQMLQGGKYLTDEPADWSQGDFNSDDRFDQQDIVSALQTGDYHHQSYDWWTNFCQLVWRGGW